MGPKFHETRRGQIFYEGTMPRISEALKRIADALEKQNELKERELGESVSDVAGEFVSKDKEKKDGNSD